MSTDPTWPRTDLDVDDARDALAEVRRRQDQTRAAGTSPWPARAVLPVLAAFPVLGYLLDVELVWAFAAGVAGLTLVAGRRAVRLRAQERSARRDMLLVAAMLLALLADVAAQALVRGAGLPLPNTWGATAAAVVVLAVVWPLQRRTGGATGRTA